MMEKKLEFIQVNLINPKPGMTQHKRMQKTH
jgi:hypothetical protein